MDRFDNSETLSTLNTIIRRHESRYDNLLALRLVSGLSLKTFEKLETNISDRIGHLADTFGIHRHIGSAAKILIG